MENSKAFQSLQLSTGFQEHVTTNLWKINHNQKDKDIKKVEILGKFLFHLVQLWIIQALCKKVL